MAKRRGFGDLEARRSKTGNKIVSWRVRFWGPDGKRYSKSFGDRLSAEMFLVEERKLIDRGEWRPPNQREAVRKLTLSAWASEYVESRTLAPATRRNYLRWLAAYVEPSIGRKYVDEVTIADVAAWHAQMKSGLRRRARASGRTNGDGAGEASQVYKLVSGVFKAAVAVGLIDSSPARVAGAGRYRRHRTPVVLTPTEVEALARALPEKYRVLADVMSWTGLRIGEARALRRRDVDVRDPDAASITVAQNVSQGGKGTGAVVGRPKTEAGSRTISIPPVLAEALAEHLLRYAQPGRDGLVFSADSELLGPTHPLVRLAAIAADANGTCTAGIRVKSDVVPPGTYPIGIYTWTRLGTRDALTLRFVALDDCAEGHAARLLADATDGNPELAPSDAARDALERRHDELWGAAQEAHRQRHEAAVDRRIAAIAAQKARRVNAARRRIEAATHPDIAAMRFGELRSAETSFDRLLAEQEAARSRADLKAMHIASVTIEVEAP